VICAFTAGTLANNNTADAAKWNIWVGTFMVGVSVPILTKQLLSLDFRLRAPDASARADRLKHILCKMFANKKARQVSIGNPRAWIADACV